MSHWNPETARSISHRRPAARVRFVVLMRVTAEAWLRDADFRPVPNMPESPVAVVATAADGHGDVQFLFAHPLTVIHDEEAYELVTVP